jgi:hypothetical protein
MSGNDEASVDLELNIERENSLLAGDDVGDKSTRKMSFVGSRRSSGGYTSGIVGWWRGADGGAHERGFESIWRSGAIIGF